VFNHAHIHGHRQITDVYLLALAVKNDARLVTFDARIPLSCVHGAQARHLVVL
jgi:predicted nuclease of predicted toxin-antitoxin system